MKRYSTYKDSGVKWIGEIPNHWKIEPFGRHFQYGKGLPITKANLQDKGIAVISYGQIHAKENFGTTLSDNLVRYVSPKYLETNPQSLLKQGDFVFADTSEDIDGSGNVAFNDYPNPIFAGYHTVIAHPVDLIFPKYDAYLFQSKSWKSQIQSLVNGVKVYSINKSIIKQSILLFPPLSEQRAIASFLDTELGKIDTYVDKEQQLIERLKELKQSVIARAVTRGINPNVKMKPSGVNWIGEIPEHWKKCRNKDIMHECKTLVGNQVDRYKLLSLTKQGVIVRDTSEGKGKFPKDFSTYKIIHPNEMVFCLFDVDETPRTVGLADIEGIVTGAYDVFETRKVVEQYIYYYYESLDDRKALKTLYRGLRKTIPMPSFMSMPIYLPPLSEQRAIVDYISSATSKIDKLISEKTKEMEYMKELRQRIISDAVTGKIDVRS